MSPKAKKKAAAKKRVRTEMCEHRVPPEQHCKRCDA